MLNIFFILGMDCGILQPESREQSVAAGAEHFRARQTLAGGPAQYDQEGADGGGGHSLILPAYPGMAIINYGNY